MAHVILVREEGQDPYVLGDGANILGRCQELMMFRAEELVDELDEQRVENGEEAGQYLIDIAPDKMSIKIKVEATGSLVAKLEISHVTLVDSNGQ